MRMDYQELQDEVRKIEKNAGEKKPYAGEVDLPKTIDFSPEEFVDTVYLDMLNDYERVVKIAKVSGGTFKQVMGRVEMPAAPGAGAAPAGPQVLMPAKAVAPVPAAKAVAPPAGPPVSAPIAQARQPAAATAPVQKAMPLPELKPPVLPKLQAPPIAPQPAARPESKSMFQLEKPAQKEAPAEPEKKAAARTPGGLEISFESKPAAQQESKAPGEADRRISGLMRKPAETPAAEQPKKEEAEFEFDFEKREERPEARRPQVPEPTGAHPEFDFESEQKEEMQEQKKEVTISQETKEALGESENTYLEKHEAVSLVVPPLLSEAPEEAAEHKFAEIGEKVPKVLEKANEGEIKKRMIEITKEIFREKSMNRRKELQAEMAKLREMLSRKPDLPKRAVSYATSFFNAMEVDQKMEIAAAKENLSRQYGEQLGRILSQFSSALKSAKGEKEREDIYNTFVADMDALKAQTESLSDKYESFFLREHTLSLEKLRSAADMKSDKYVSEKAEERLKEMKFNYAAEFLALEDAMRKEIASLVKGKRHEALEARMSEETEKVLSIVNMKEEELLKYMHASHPDRYAELESGKVAKLELLSKARALMAKDAGLKKDIIIKYFGEI